MDPLSRCTQQLVESTGKENLFFLRKLMNCFTIKMTVLRYCSELSGKTELVPRWTEEEICCDAVNPDWMDKITAEMEQNSPLEKLYRAHLLLPHNSPLREEMIGPALPSKLFAKRAVALEACKKLHQLGELDNVHLLPITQVDQLEDEPVDEDATQLTRVTLKIHRIYVSTMICNVTFLCCGYIDAIYLSPRFICTCYIECYVDYMYHQCNIYVSILQ